MLSRLPGRTWSILLAGAALTRALSYRVRPPEVSNTTELIESVIPYTTWAIMLITAASVVIVGATTRRPASDWLTLTGHLALVFCYSIFALSILVAAIAYDGSWSTLGAIVIVALLHAERVMTIATALGRR